MILALIIPTMGFNFFTGAKSQFLAPAAVMAIAYIVVRRRIALRWIAVAFLAVILLYPIAEFHRRVILKSKFGAAHALRTPVQTVSRIARYALSHSPGEYLLVGLHATSIRFDALGVTAVILRECPSRVPYQRGWTLGYIVVSYVPRVAWPGKPEVSIGQWVTDNFVAEPGVLRSHTGPSWIGELYFNFGWPGIVIGMLLIGVYMRILHEMFFRTDAPLPAQLMSVVVLFTIAPTIQAAVMTPINGPIFGAMPLVIAHWVVRLAGGAPLPRRREAADDPSGGAVPSGAQPIA
jgi:hypothetical protein